MDTTPQAFAGTLESNDIFITIAPGHGAENRIELESTVLAQFGAAITAAITEVIDQYGLSGLLITARDKGALDCTIRARTEAAALRYKERIA